ncbi:MAG: hypothetical protein ACR2NM_12940 [Bythopirellula sp.]
MTRRSNPQLAGSLVTCIVAISLTGCEPTSGRESVAGIVSFAGQQLADGNILFRPIGDGQTAGAKISQGKFKIPRDPGLLPGKYRVEIKAMRAVGKKYTDSESGEEVQDREQYIPARYNTRTELTCEVTAGGENRFDFELTETEN